MEKKYQLPREFAEKWVEALRSGEYKQTDHKLINNKGDYCCLGVACKIVGMNDIVLKEHNTTVICDGWAYSKGIPEGLNDRLHKMCVDMNDIERKSFPEIADWITDNVEFI